MQTQVVEIKGKLFKLVKDADNCGDACDKCAFDDDHDTCINSGKANDCMVTAGAYWAPLENSSEVINSFTHNGVQFDLMVAKLVKPGEDIIASLTPEKADTLHMAVGIAGEAGELLDAIKKFVVYNKDLDRPNVVEELGDLEFYMEGIRRRLGITREETLAACIDKLGVRYKDGYSDKAAQERADKQ